MQAVFWLIFFDGASAVLQRGNVKICFEYFTEKMRIGIANKQADLLYWHIGADEKLAGVSHTQRNNVFTWGASNDFTKNDVIT